MTSPDGVRVACDVTGSGTPLVMVHGAGSGRWTFDLVRPHLEDRFETWSIDRRGRADSSDDSLPYAIEREFDDVGAVVREAGPGALLFGHSYGALVAAGAAASLGDLPRLALYEPPMGGVLADQAWTDRFEAQLGAGERDLAVREFMRDVGGYSDADIDAMEGTPGWQARVEVVHTVTRELRAERAFELASLELGDLGTPALLLLGSESPEWARRSAEAFATAIPSAELRTLHGHGHGAALSGPELLASELRAFLA